MTPLPIYLDYAATTPVDARVAEVMSRYLTFEGDFGNPASRSHVYGWRAEAAVEEARRNVADLIGADPREIVWTSGATEANNLAIKGAAQAHAGRGRHIVTSLIEHKAVLDCCHELERQGWEVTWLRPSAEGLIQPAQVAEALRPDTVLVSIMHVNNELGTVNDIGAMGAICRERGALFHVDAAQGAGKLPLDMSALAVDLLSMSAHKVYGPKGMGALYVRRKPRALIHAQMHGGGHERGLRSGTLATHQIVGMGEAFRIAAEGLKEEGERIRSLRDRFLSGLADAEGVHLNGTLESRALKSGTCEQHVPGIVNLSFAGVDGELLLIALKGLAVSTGSACTSASLEPSYVLKALGLKDSLAHASVRFSFGRHTTDADVESAVGQVRDAVAKLRGDTLRS